MNVKKSIDSMAIFGGGEIFSVPKSTSNLFRPDFDKFLKYSNNFIEQKRYTNNGPNVRLLEERLALFHNAEFCVTFSSGFWALVLAIRSLALESKSEIILPSLTYRRMTDIVAWTGLKPHFCEVESETLAMSAETVMPHINEDTALILGVHPIVNCCDVDGLVSLAKEKNIPILFDSVESVYESIAAGKIGSFGNAECFSLHACKLFNGFGGGYLTTGDKELATRLASLRTFGFTGVDNVDVPGGMNAKLNEMHAAMTLASMDDIESQVELNQERYYTYKTHLSSVSGIRLLEFDEDFQTSFKNIVVEVLDDWPISRNDTIKILNAENILARAYYFPALHRKKSEFQSVDADLPITDMLSERFINLPCGQLVSCDDIVEIVGFLNFISSNSDVIKSRLNKVL